MPPEIKLRPMSNTSFRLMTWYFDLNDKLLHLVKTPIQHLKKAPLKEGMVVVDYGCGPGRYAIPAAEITGPKGKVYAVDIQPLAIETVKRKAAAKSLTQIQTVLVDSYHTGIQDASADLVLLIDAIQGIKEPAALMAEIHRMLKPAGVLFMDSGHLKIAEVTRLIESTGLFTLTKLEGHDMLLSRRDSKPKIDTSIVD